MGHLSSGHNEVCYEVKNCPACDALSDKNKEIEELRQENVDLENRVKSLTRAIQNIGNEGREAKE